MDRAQPKSPGHRHLSDAEASEMLKKAGLNRHERRRVLAEAKKKGRKKGRKGEARGV